MPTTIWPGKKRFDACFYRERDFPANDVWIPNYILEQFAFQEHCLRALSEKLEQI